MIWGKGTSLRSAEQVAILYLERTHFIATDNQLSYNILRQKKYSHESDLGTTAPGTINLVRAKQGEGRNGQDRHDENLKEVGEIGKYTRPRRLNSR